MRDRLRENLLRFTDRAFAMMSSPAGARVLDIGCGTGVPTVRLVELGVEEVVGMDTDVRALRSLLDRASQRGVARRVSVCAGSADCVPFRDASFDIVWCEGALFVLGFRDSLRAWRRLVRPGGVLVVHDEAGDTTDKLRWAEAEGYAVSGWFPVGDEDWWEYYFEPASRRSAADLDDEIRTELREARSHPERLRSAFFVLKKRG
ncbi:MAG: class I SAM-dependent methyltransferase [Gemmatimonadota bacterium]